MVEKISGNNATLPERERELKMCSLGSECECTIGRPIEHVTQQWLSLGKARGLANIWQKIWQRLRDQVTSLEE